MKRTKTVTVHCDLKKKVLYFALSSRVFVLLLSFFSNILIPDHDPNVFKFPQPSEEVNAADRVVKVLLGGLARWDAQYFLHISLYGYTYENTLAFFPLFPFFTSQLTYVLKFVFGPILNSVSLVLISAVFLNFLFFIKAATTFFELSCEVLKDDKIAYISSLLFCINPASIFFTAPYSESCFSFFTFSGLLFCLRHDNSFLASMASGLSAIVRSNGLLNFGFLAHKSFKSIFQYISKSKKMINIISFVSFKIFALFVITLTFFTPFALFQIYSYHRFCVKKTNVPDFFKDFAESKQYVLPGSNTSPWCNYSIPISYSYVQNHYWDVGFLKYYQLKQIPNFLLAFPIIFLILKNSYRFIQQNKSSSKLHLLGFNNLKFVKFQNQVLGAEFLVFVVHAVCLTVFCVLFIHIQVSTRMICCSCPVFYWLVTLRYWCEPVGTSATAEIESRLDKRNPKFTLVETTHNMERFWKTCVLTEDPPNGSFYFIKIYFVFYLIFGTILFSNFYPWT